jgi:hypothetical protein
MDTIFREFGEAFSQQNGYQLSQTLTSQLPKDMIRVIWRSANHHDIKSVLRRGILNSSSSVMTRLPREEVDGWVEVYYAYWKSCEHLLACQEGSPNVSTILLHDKQAQGQSLTKPTVIVDQSIRGMEGDVECPSSRLHEPWI